MSEYQELQDEYLKFLPETLDEIEALILKMEDNVGADNNANLNRLMGRVHTVKGASGSYGLSLLSTICHNFEDQINEQSRDQFDPTSIDQYLHFLDFIRKAVESYKNGEDVSILQEEFNKFLPSKKNFRHNALIVEGNKFLKKQYIAKLAEVGVKCSFAMDAFSALERLINENFDSLVTSQVVGKMSGTSLIKAIKVIDEIDSSIPCVLTTSISPQDATKLGVEIDYIVQKDEAMIQNLVNSYREIINKNSNAIVLLDETPKEAKLKRILYIDDDSDLHPLVKFGLKKLETLTELKICSSGEEALEVYQDFAPDLVLLDYMMPGMNGPETMMKIKKKKHVAPVVFLTGKDTEKEIQEIKKIGAAGIINKPFEPGHLSEYVLKIWNSL